MKSRKIMSAGVSLGALSLGILGTVIYIQGSKRTQTFPAMTLMPPAKKLGTQGELTTDKISQLLENTSLAPSSHLNEPVDEPELPDGVALPPDAEALGFGKSMFLVDSRWTTIRYVGAQPAGAGLSGAELNRAQIEALGTIHDTIPVTTTAQTIDEMMENYFVPLLTTLPRGQEILSRIKVQGAYFAPRSDALANNVNDRDNAFVVGVQSIYIYPNSCFDKTSANICHPVSYSAGHDPTIIGHELSHVIFNHLRDERSLEGWQWFAVNEGYADYFSASYFGDPVLGRIWRVTRPTGARYLRRLLDTPTTNDAKALEEGHAFGLVWSSALWRSRQLIISTFKVKPFDFDRVVLMSINFLGESTKTKLGDAATAMLKSAEVLGHSQWKKILSEEFNRSEVELAKGTRISAATGDTIEVQQSGVRCGSLAPSASNPHAGNSEMPWHVFVLLLTPVCLGVLRNRRCKANGLVICTTVLLNGCQLSQLWKKEENKPGGVAIVYKCNLSALRDGTPLTPTERLVTFTFADTQQSEQLTEQVFVGDDRFENAESSLLLIIDKSAMRIDQYRKRDGSLFQLNLGQKYFSTEDAIAIQNMRLSEIIIEGAARAWKKESTKASATNSNKQVSAVSFDVTGAPATATIKKDVVGPRGFGPLANDISLNGAQLCTYQKTSQ